MNSFRQIIKRTLLLWAILLPLALIGAQGAKLHIHNLDHGHNEHLSHTHPIDEADGHSHLSKAHLIHDSSHNEHHDGAISEIDLSPDGLLKSTNSHFFAIAIFALFFTLITFVCSQRFGQRSRKNKPVNSGYYILSPPLRAPPQH